MDAEKTPDAEGKQGALIERLEIAGAFSTGARAALYHGDCLAFLETIPDESLQLIVTSPPYNIGKEYEKRLEIDEYLAQQGSVIRECTRALRPEGSICWEVGNYVENGEIVPLDILLYDCFRQNRLKLRNRIIWHFGHGLHCRRRFSGRYESILWFTKGDDYVFDLDAVRIPQKYPGKKHFQGTKAGEYSCNPAGKNPSDVWDIPNVKSNHIEKTCHPCQFPVALAERLVLALTREGDIVFDPFLGVGSTAVAGILNGRRVAGSEIVKKYYDIACERVMLAYEGSLRYRPDRPVYEPPSSLALAKNPFLSEK
ncbi:adenine-specific methyltransferase [hydrocarbon metagenome]|uniref:site-specific DNA-methyltransferase (cytosine-N(4)-specific) n=1 Tax=hydrocarbon metagenome TaxID=938273 RepID=A0A0W8FJ81_9ZZZZ|nr:site-specific DNA-methyltransferase [Methanomicrobiaceae archaeon]